MATKKPFKKVEGRNYTAAHVGEWSNLENYSFNYPSVADPQYGKLFLKEVLNLTGMEVSINKMSPHTQMPYSHKHVNNEELFIFIRGRGQFQIDDEIVDVQEGTVIRVAPEAIRTWVNNSDEDLYFIVIQSREGSMRESGIFDGVPIGMVDFMI